MKAWQNHKGFRSAASSTRRPPFARSAHRFDRGDARPCRPRRQRHPRRGARGRAVAALQLALINRGYVPTGGVDGIFGLATEKALKRFQQNHGLNATGQGDAATLQALGLAAGASSNSPAASTSSGQLALRQPRLGRRRPPAGLVQPAGSPSPAVPTASSARPPRPP